MTRRECETKLLALAEEMRRVYMEYNPAGDYLSMISDVDGYTSVSDCFFYGDKVINSADESVFHTVDVVRYSNGDLRHGNVIEAAVCG